MSSRRSLAGSHCVQIATRITSVRATIAVKPAINTTTTPLASRQPASSPRVARSCRKAGRKAAVSAPSPNMPRARLGTRNATEKASINGPLPKAAAMPTSRIRPSTRLRKVRMLTVRSPEVIPPDRPPPCIAPPESPRSDDLSHEGLESGAIDVKSGKDFDHAIRGQSPIDRPIDDVEVLVAGINAVENAIDQNILGRDHRVDLARRFVVELGPAAPAAKMFQPPVAAIAAPVLAEPVANGLVAQVASVFLALDPFMTLCFAERFVVNAGSLTRT